MVVGRFFVSPEARIPGFLAKAMGEGSANPNPAPQTAIPNVARPSMANVAPPQVINSQAGYGGSPSGWSQYGPSRFSDAYNGNQTHPNQASASFQRQGFMPNAAQRSNANQGQPFSLAGYPTAPGSAGSLQRQQPAPVSPMSIKRDKILYTKDWMPWSMIAAGAIVVLYTNSLARRPLDS